MSFTIDFFSFAIYAADGFLAVEAGTRAARGRVGVWAAGEDRQALGEASSQGHHGLPLPCRRATSGSGSLLDIAFATSQGHDRFGKSIE